MHVSTLQSHQRATAQSGRCTNRCCIAAASCRVQQAQAMPRSHAVFLSPLRSPPLAPRTACCSTLQGLLRQLGAGFGDVFPPGAMAGSSRVRVRVLRAGLVLHARVSGQHSARVNLPIPLALVAVLSCSWTPSLPYATQLQAVRGELAEERRQTYL